MKILGISCFYHDSAAALVIDGRVVAAAQEERFTRKKHDAAFPIHAIRYCLAEGKIDAAELDAVVFYEKPFLKLERQLEMYLAYAPRGFASFAKALPVWIREKLFQKSLLIKYFRRISPNADWEKKMLFSEHHLSHAASAFFVSPFEKAAVLTLDGVGEWCTTSLFVGSANKLECQKEILFPHSLGLLYSAFTYYTGFKVNSGEYKLMGLAPYGRPIYTDKIYANIIDVKDDGSFRLNLDYFNYCTGLTMISPKMEELFGRPARKAEEEVTQFEMDIAASIQQVLEEVLEKILIAARHDTGQENLCLAGGVALNCVANGKLLKKGIFKNIWIQPAAGDAGGALGAALAAHYLHFKQSRLKVTGSDDMNGSYLGPQFSAEEIRKALTRAGAKFREFPHEADLIAECAELLKSGKALGWFQGRMEFGPRALGGRSIIADPRSRDMQSTLNLKVKFRESFRPFAPAVLAEDQHEWFDIGAPSPYMLLVGNVREKKRLAIKDASAWGMDLLKQERSQIPAVTHVDYSARVQSVDGKTNPLFHELLRQFKLTTGGCGVLVNTSFNVRGEPIVCTPEDAFRCFMGTGIEALAVGNFLLLKAEQDPALAEDYKNHFELD